MEPGWLTEQLRECDCPYCFHDAHWTVTVLGQFADGSWLFPTEEAAEKAAKDYAHAWRAEYKGAVREHFGRFAPAQDGEAGRTGGGG